MTTCFDTYVPSSVPVIVAIILSSIYRKPSESTGVLYIIYNIQHDPCSLYSIYIYYIS
jgi:hypothetical protein